MTKNKVPFSRTSKADKTEKNTKKDDALPQLGGSVSIFLPVLGFVLITLSGVMFFKRDRLNMKKQPKKAQSNLMDFSFH